MVTSFFQCVRKDLLLRYSNSHSMEHMELTSIDLYLLSNSSNCHVVVKTGTLKETGKDALKNVLQLYAKHQQNLSRNLFQLAGIGRTTNGHKDTQFRGDHRCWISAGLCDEFKLFAVKSLISKIVAECRGRLKVEHGLNDYYSVQVALYRGDGAHYVRHLDAGTGNAVTNSNFGSDQSQHVAHIEGNRSGAACPGQRRLTFIYYLNEPPEDTTVEVGGKLRVYNIPRQTVNEVKHKGEAYMDITPAMGTLVVFRSDLVEHEVMPTYRDRWAITLWAYAHDTVAPTAANVQGAAATGNATFPSSSLSPAPMPLLSLQTSFCPLSTASYSAASDAASTGPPALIVPETGDPFTVSQQRVATIFVSIVSYRDSELPHTVRDLFATATHPDRVTVGIVYQLNSPTDKATCRLLPEHLSAFDASVTNTSTNSSSKKKGRGGTFYRHHVRTLSLPHTEAKGPIFARHLAASLYGGEDFVLQIDSHMRFRRGWDAYLVHLLDSIEKTEGCDKVVLSTYPLGYHLPNQVPEDTRPTILVPSRVDELGFLRQEGKVLDLSPAGEAKEPAPTPRYLRSALWAAGFSFSRGVLLCEVPYSPLLPHLFFGEELSMAARLHTHGWDLFAPAETVLYHLYSRQHRPTFQELQQLPPSTASAAVCVTEPVVIETQKRRSMRMVQHMLGLSMAQHEATEDNERSASKGDAELVALQNLNEKHFGLGGARALDSFWTMLVTMGVIVERRSVTSAAAAAAGGAGANEEDDTILTAARLVLTKQNEAQRLDFIHSVGAQGAATAGTRHFQFASSRSVNPSTATAQRAPAPATPQSATGAAISAKLSANDPDARFLQLLASTSGLGGRIQGFL